METILPLVILLNEGRFEYQILKKRLADMLAMGNYQCIGVYRDMELIGISGFWVLNKLYAGKHIEPDNVYVKPEYRSKGIGELMMNWLAEYGKQLGCEGLEVNCYAKNIKGKKFWESQGFDALGYHMIKKF
ncbi:GNAT family N-acetyltransferase [Confluentibacter sediminis]|uniref:GNAT family N-acetyltransferase n=1 Tax=Confluentibacter sediminis TaxID=2219045 RepID=UPI001F1B4B69|nr:GNAT family N-acetyltransferase [Confluentibacter sediminis]